MKVQTVLRLRLDLADILKKTNNCHFLATFLLKIRMTASKIAVPNVKFGVDS